MFSLTLGPAVCHLHSLKECLLACERWKQQNSEKLTHKVDLPGLTLLKHVIKQFLFKMRLFRVLCMRMIKQVPHIIKAKD